MTLSEAYEKLRKEAIILRRENAKLKSGTYTDSEKLAYEKEIKQLKHQLADALKEKDHYHTLWRNATQKKYDFMNSTEHQRMLQEILNYKTQIINLSSSVYNLNRRITSLESEIAALSDELSKSQYIVAKLKSQMNRNHENSSIPSSKERFPKKIKNSRIKTDRKPGAQTGHSGHKRPHMEPTEPVISIPVPKDILSNPDYYLTGKIISKQLVDISVSVSVKDYQTPEYRSRSTGIRGHASFPEGISNEFSYGPNVKGLAFLLNNYCNVSIDKTAELIKGISDGKIILSKGLINSLPKQFSDNTAPARQRIYNNLLLAPVMYTDFTPGRVNGKTVQIIVCATDSEMLYIMRDHKGHQGIKGTPVEEYEGVLVHDHDRTFYNYGSAHQECLAHVLRYLQDSIENEPDLTWNKSMKTFLASVIDETKTHPNGLSEKRIKELEYSYQCILDKAKQEYQDNPPPVYYPDGHNLYQRMMKYQKEHLYFIHHPEVGYTNNISERDLRKFKRKQHQATAFRSNESVAQLCNCMSIIETNRLYETNIFKVAVDGFNN